MGFVLLDGYDRYRTYLKDALDKLGVDINVFRVGAFKSAVETYTRTSMSPEDREESRSYLNALWSSYQQAVTRARKLPADALTKYVATLAKTVPAAGGDAPQVALQAGLITGIRSRLEVERRLIELAGQDDSSGSFKSVPAADYVRYARAENKLHADGKPRVGVIVAAGEILDGDQPPGTVGGESTARLIRAARLDKDVKALVLRVDRTLGKVGVSVDGVGTTPLSGQLRIDRPLGEEARALLQSQINRGYDEFLVRVASGRNKTHEQVDAIAQGRVWAGADAHRLGLVDQLGSFSDAVKAAARRAKLSDYAAEFLEPELTWAQELALQLKSRAA